MGQPELENQTAFACEPLFLSDEENRALLVPVIKATYDITAVGLSLAETQVPVNLAGEMYGDRTKTSYRYEPECAFIKLATDAVLVGTAVAPRSGTREMLVAFQVGPLKKGVRVLGDRVFVRTVTGVGMTRPVSFERVPLRWERAFGGWDRSAADATRHTCELRNPVGVGYHGSGAPFEEGLPCPNLEDPVRPFKGWGDRATPVGFGFVSPHWQPRTAHAGTYDEAWQKTRSPLLAGDFDRRFFNAAPSDLVATGYLRGDEAVVASGVTAAGGVSFHLPGVSPPAVLVEQVGQQDAWLATVLDTVIVDADEQKVFLLWRGLLRIREATAVRSIRICADGAASSKREVSNG